MANAHVFNNGYQEDSVCIYCGAKYHNQLDVKCRGYSAFQRYSPPDTHSDRLLRITDNGTTIMEVPDDMKIYRGDFGDKKEYIGTAKELMTPPEDWEKEIALILERDCGQTCPNGAENNKPSLEPIKQLLLQREEKLRHDHEILVNTIIDTKNEEIQKIRQELKRNK